MQILSAIILSCALFSTSLLIAEQQKMGPCACKNCKCTTQKHCGCYSDQGCTCGENCSCGSSDGCKDRLLSTQAFKFHHDNPKEHDHDLV